MSDEDLDAIEEAYNDAAKKNGAKSGRPLRGSFKLGKGLG